MLAITHLPSPRMADCQLTYVARNAIDYDLALQQHAEYCSMLSSLNVDVRTLEGNCEMPDCVFVEDAAVVLDEAALITRPGAETRRNETAAIEFELRTRRSIVDHTFAPATLEGGDVLRVGRTLLVGHSSRTNPEGAEVLQAFALRYGYTVRVVPVRGALHLKTACTALPDGRLLVNREWIDSEALSGFPLIPVPTSEPWGANLLCVGDVVCAAAHHSETVAMIRRMGFDVQTTEMSEFAKAEGGVTCLSILLADDQAG